MRPLFFFVGYGNSSNAYYLVVQPVPVFPLRPEGAEGPLVLHVEGKPRAEREDFFHPADLGTFSGDFSHAIDIEQFDDYTLDYRKTGDHDTLGKHRARMPLRRRDKTIRAGAWHILHLQLGGSTSAAAGT